MTVTVEQRIGVLAGWADCFHPTTDIGKEFLTTIAEQWVTESHNWDDPDEAAWQIVDAAIPWRTYDVWIAFADLGAYQIDVSEIGLETAPIFDQARAALGLIGDELIRAIRQQQDEGGH